MTASVLLPFAGDDPSRTRALEWVHDKYLQAGYEVVVGYGDPERWVKAEAVSDALERATGDLLVLADADVWCDKTPRAVVGVEAGAPWAMPHYQVRRLTEDATNAVYAGEEPNPKSKTTRRHDGAIGGGIAVIPRKLYEQVPLDPRFVGWGGEDHAWGMALATLAGRPQRLQGVCWHLWHPTLCPPPGRRFGFCATEQNEQLRQRYEAAYNRPDVMRALLAEVVGWRATRQSSSSVRPDMTSTATR